MEPKRCPLMYTSGNGAEACLKENCEWWAETRIKEKGICEIYEACALKILAMTGIMAQ